MKDYGWILDDPNILNIYPYGSVVYGNNSVDSDADFILITNPGHEINVHEGEINFTSYTLDDFEKELWNHEISVLECYFLGHNSNWTSSSSPYNPRKTIKINIYFNFHLNRTKLRESLSAKASNSFVKAKKKFEISNEFYIAKKSLFHSLRILKFGIEIATLGKLENYSSANEYWNEIKNNPSIKWEDYKKIYQPIYNELKTEFRKVCPK